MKRRQGFTLLELLVVLVILALLAAATPRLLPSDGVRLLTVVHDFAATLHRLRVDAMRRGILIDLIPSGTSYHVSPSGEAQRLPHGIIMQLKDTAPNLLGLQSDHITFFPDGSSTGGVIMLRQQRKAVSIVVSWLTGRAQVRE